MSTRGKCARTRAAAEGGVGPARTSPVALQIAGQGEERGDCGRMTEDAHADGLTVLQNRRIGRGSEMVYVLWSKTKACGAPVSALTSATARG